MVREAFLYLWRDSKNKMYYLGVHKHKDGDDYAHTSSVMESFTYSTRPPYMKRRILAWGTFDDMFKLESKLLSVKSKLDRYYNVNKTPNTQKAGRLGGLANKGKKKTPEHRAKLSESNKGQKASFPKLTDEQREKHRQGCMGNKNFDINKPGVRQNHSNGMKEYWRKRKLNDSKQTIKHEFF